MIQVTPHAKIFILHEPVSFRNGIRGLCAIAKQLMHSDPMDGSYFVFRGKSGHAARVLCYDRLGWWLTTRELSKGSFKWWPKGQGQLVVSPLVTAELQLLLAGGDPSSTKLPPPWRKLA